jgi:hypothetical protein
LAKFLFQNVEIATPRFELNISIAVTVDALMTVPTGNIAVLPDESVLALECKVVDPRIDPT